MKFSKDDVAPKVALHKILSETNRYRAIVLLSQRKESFSVGDMAAALGMSNSALSHLLSYLHEANVVAFKRNGRTILYSLAKSPAARNIAKML